MYEWKLKALAIVMLVFVIIRLYQIVKGHLGD